MELQSGVSSVKVGAGVIDGNAIGVTVLIAVAGANVSVARPIGALNFWIATIKAGLAKMAVANVPQSPMIATAMTGSILLNAGLSFFFG
jgi:hypothetical protein